MHTRLTDSHSRSLPHVNLERSANNECALRCVRCTRLTFSTPFGRLCMRRPVVASAQRTWRRCIGFLSNKPVVSGVCTLSMVSRACALYNNSTTNALSPLHFFFTRRNRQQIFLFTVNSLHAHMQESPSLVLACVDSALLFSLGVDYLRFLVRREIYFN